MEDFNLKTFVPQKIIITETSYPGIKPRLKFLNQPCHLANNLFTDPRHFGTRFWQDMVGAVTESDRACFAQLFCLGMKRGLFRRESCLVYLKKVKDITYQ
jgi:hypothetical protein